MHGLDLVLELEARGLERQRCVALRAPVCLQQPERLLHCFLRAEGVRDDDALGDDDETLVVVAEVAIALLHARSQLHALADVDGRNGQHARCDVPCVSVLAVWRLAVSAGRVCFDLAFCAVK